MEQSPGSEDGTSRFGRERFETRLRDLNPDLFSYVKSQTTIRDRLSLLALHNACRDLHGSFRYLEIGSHLGGTLQVAVADHRCTAITSIDPRPLSVPDDVRGDVPYPENSTERMLEGLSWVPGADLTKLHPIEASTDGLSPSEVAGAELCFIDGEHTHEAVLRDARFCRQVLGGEGVIAFHDSWLVGEAIEEFCSELEGGTFSSGPAPAQIHVVELGPTRVMNSRWLIDLMEAPQTGLAIYKPGPAAKWRVSFSPHGQANKSGGSYEVRDLSPGAPAALLGTWRVTRVTAEAIELDDGPGGVSDSSSIPNPGLGPYTCSARWQAASRKKSVR